MNLPFIYRNLERVKISFRNNVIIFVRQNFNHCVNKQKAPYFSLKNCEKSPVDCRFICDINDGFIITSFGYNLIGRSNFKVTKL